MESLSTVYRAPFSARTKIDLDLYYEPAGACEGYALRIDFSHLSPKELSSQSSPSIGKSGS